MMKSRPNASTRGAALVFVASAMVAGCLLGDSSGKVSTPEDYQYKGHPDPLLAESAADRAGVLSERLQLIQGRQ